MNQRSLYLITTNTLTKSLLISLTRRPSFRGALAVLINAVAAVAMGNARLGEIALIPGNKSDIRLNRNSLFRICVDGAYAIQQRALNINPFLGSMYTRFVIPEARKLLPEPIRPEVRQKEKS